MTTTDTTTPSGFAAAKRRREQDELRALLRDEADLTKLAMERYGDEHLGAYGDSFLNFHDDCGDR
ncbi:hypothetical protein [Azospirillum aestuarii]|uniref:hypothetical protein n=1 Tax=Azospirillum aestuarii TaxID=2802052 RepID=UPI004054A4BD